MNSRERDEFLSEPHTAVLATVDAKGRAHAVPVWYLWNGESFEIIGGKDSAKMRHVEMRGRKGRGCGRAREAALPDPDTRALVRLAGRPRVTC